MHFINIIEYELVQRKIKGRETVLEAGKVGLFLFIANKTIWEWFQWEGDLPWNTQVLRPLPQHMEDLVSSQGKPASSESASGAKPSRRYPQVGPPPLACLFAFRRSSAGSILQTALWAHPVSVWAYPLLANNIYTTEFNIKAKKG